jgi:myxalamid-type polyketide synthase MxaB
MNPRQDGAPGNFCTLVELLRHRATIQPNKLAYRFLKEEKQEEIAWSYAELDQRARRIAARLETLGMAGERVLLLYPPSLDYIAAFFGCLYAGAIAVPAYPPRPNKPMPRIEAISDDCHARVVLTTSPIQADAQRRIEQLPSLASLQWISTDDLPPGSEEAWRTPASDAATLAFLQYTSGSTGNPKGVMVTHGNLLHNLEVIRQGFRIDPQGMGVTWLPMYHDMGLIGGILAPMYVGGPATLMSPVSFLQRPVSWLQAITRYQGTISGAPNFAYELCAEKVTDEQKATLDLSSWDVAFTGAEPVRAETLERFAQAFAACGFRRSSFYPCFGLAEGTLMLTGGSGAAEPITYTVQRASLGEHTVQPARPGEQGAQTLVACGHALVDQQVVIVHPESHTLCQADEVGEVWARGPSMAQGYWNRPEETEHTFNARLADTHDGPFMRTGDLGFLHEGELYVTGRLKDLIIIRGRNHYPQDIERTGEQSHPALRADCGAAFSIDVDGDERLVIVQEVEREYRKPNVEEIASAVRRAVAAHHDLQVHAIALVKTMTIPKTSSGKIQRRQCRADFLAGNLSLVGEWTAQAATPTDTSATTPKAAAKPSVEQAAHTMADRAASVKSAEEISAWLIAQIAERLSVPASEIDVTQPFDRYGLDSLAAVTLSGDLEQYLNRSLSPTLVYEHSTIAELAAFLVADAPATIPTATTAANQDEPIAVIGMGCRFPGGANDPESFWKLLKQGADCVSEVPADRWNAADYYDPNPHAPGKMSTRWGGFIRDVDRFDPQFFGIAPREAVSMDPQQRLFLEVSWEALENAGQRPDKLAGSQTGVFMGICSSDYGHMLHASGDPTQIDAYYGTGSAFSVAAGRVSYVLGLHGPNLPIDTACSSSLVAVHLAMQSLRGGECRMALAGGVNLLLAPESMIYFSKVQAMSPDGRCKTFDASANGYVRGEGCGVVVLKRLSDAQADGDQVLAVLRGSAVNHDGRSNGLTAPNGSAQEVVIRQALRSAGVAPSEVGYVEAHGTGTSLGDPIEVRALGAVLSVGRSPSEPVTVSSVKTNIGHLEAAAGVAGLIKVVLSLMHEEIPPHLHFQQINPHIPIEQLPIAIPTRGQTWKRGDKRRIAGISSFGFSGTNAHLIVEEAPPLPAIVNERERPLHLLTLSAKTAPALDELVGKVAEHVASHPEQPMADLAYSANTSRAVFAQRLAIVAENSEELAQKLSALRRGEEPLGVKRGSSSARPTRPKIAMLFTGQGAQYAGMGRELYQTQPTFRRTLEECQELLRGVLDKPLLAVLYPEDGNDRLVHETAYTQPALFAIEVAIYQLWRSWGVEPAVVLGHSVGEYVAACVAGVFSLQDGLRLIAERARRMQALPAGGQMAAVFASPQVVEAAIAPYAAEVSIAAYNGPENVVISGAGEAIEAIVGVLETQGIRATRLSVSHAFHSPLMEPMLDEFQRFAAGIEYQPPKLRLISNLTGQLADKELPMNADYWRRHVRAPVRFAESVQTLAAQGYELLLEAGPSPTLVGMARRCLPGDAPQKYLPSLREGRGDWQPLLDSLAQLYLAGVDIDWQGFDRDYARRRVPMPNYPFQRQRYWLETTRRPAAAQRIAHADDAAHPLLGVRLRSPLKDAQFEAELSTSVLPYMADHRVYGHVVLPAAAYLEMALSAASSALGTAAMLKQVRVLEPLFLTENTIEVQTIVSPGDEEGHVSFQIASLSPGESEPAWRVHATGQAGASTKAPAAIDRAEIEQRANEPVAKSIYYQRLDEQGLQYGPKFQGLAHIQRRPGEAFGELRLPEGLAANLPRYRLHPSLLDASFQLLGAAVSPQALERMAYVPVGLERFEVYQSLPAGEALYCHATSKQGEATKKLRLFSGDVQLIDSQGRLVAEIVGLTLARVPREMFLRGAPHTQDKAHFDPAEWLYELQWRPRDQRNGQPANMGFNATAGRWLILADQSGLGTALAEQLELRGERPVVVAPGEAFRRESADRYQVALDNAADIQHVLAELAADSQRGPWRGVVHLTGCDDPAIASVDELNRYQQHACGSLLHLVQSLAALSLASKPRLWIATCGAQQLAGQTNPARAAQATLWGLARVAALEHADLACTRIDLDPATGEAHLQDNLAALLAELAAPDREDQIAYRDGIRYVARLIRWRSNEGDQHAAAAGAQPMRLEIPQRGVLGNLKRLPAARRAPGRGEVEIEVAATGLNFRDVLNVLGLYPGDPGPLGGECSGVIAAVGEGVTEFAVGDAVLGIASGSFSTFVITQASLIAKKPAAISFAEAATIPITFMTAHYALHHLAGMQAGDRVLIQAAAGGVGLAAVQLARLAGAEIFGTAGSAAKREYLVEQGVAADHLLNSRTTEFAEQIVERTGGQGVRIVLNSLAGEFIPKGLSIVQPGGHFLEIGKAELWDRERVAAVNPRAQYTTIALDQMVIERPAFVGQMLRELLPRFESGELKPLRLREFPIEEAESAFRYMAQARHIGKVVITQGELRNTDCGLRNELDGSRVVTIRGDASYLITGGLGALGLSTARWLTAQGARHLVLVGRSAPSGDASSQLADLERQGVKLLVLQGDLASSADVARIFEQVKNTLPPLRGIVHAAGVLDDGVLTRQEWSRFEKVFGPKVAGGWNLDKQSRQLDLDFLVMFSSMASVVGSPGQGNYAAANAYLDALAHQRRAMGLPGTSINWGPWADAGMAATRSQSDQRRWTAQGITPIATDLGLRLLGMLLKHSPAEAAVLPVDWAQWTKTYPKLAQSPLYEELVDPAAQSGAGADREAILSAAPAERQARLEQYLRSQIAKVLELPADQFDLHEPLKALGLDSLMAIELKNLVEANLAVDIPAVKLLEGPSIAELAAVLAPQLGADTTVVARPSSNGQDGSPASRWLAYYEPRESARLRLFCFHYLGGGASAFRQWQQGLPPEIEVCPVQLPGREQRIHETPCQQMLPLAAMLAEQLQPMLDRPFALYGHSMGALLAFELARQLRNRDGLEPVHLFAAAYLAPHAPGPYRQRQEYDRSDLDEVVRRLLNVPEAVLANDEFMSALLPTINADLRLVGSYAYQEQQPLACPITAFGGLSDREVKEHDLLGWRRHTRSSFRLEMFPGGHLFLEPSQAALLTAIGQSLAANLRSPAVTLSV